MKLFKFEVKKRFRSLRWLLLLHIFLLGSLLLFLQLGWIDGQALSAMTLGGSSCEMLLFSLTSFLILSYQFIEPLLDFRKEILSNSNQLYFTLPVEKRDILNVKLIYGILQSLVLSAYLVLVFSVILVLTSANVDFTYLFSALSYIDTSDVLALLSLIMNLTKVLLIGFLLVMVMAKYFEKNMLVMIFFPIAFVAILSLLNIPIDISGGMFPIGSNVGMRTMEMIASTVVILFLYACNYYYIEDRLEIANS